MPPVSGPATPILTRDGFFGGGAAPWALRPSWALPCRSRRRDEHGRSHDGQAELMRYCSSISSAGMG